MKPIKRAHYIKHAPFEGLGSIEAWLQLMGYEISCTSIYETTDLPDLDGIDLLILMGGSMSVNDEAELPWLITEKAYIRKAIQANMPLLGICLGAQLIASALGARVYPNAVKEIGWFPVEAVSAETDQDSDFAVFQFPESALVFHWHGETFDLPDGALPLARSAMCENQAFQIGPSIIGLQFHLETTPQSAREFIEGCRNELVDSPTIQSEAELLAAPVQNYAVVNQLMGQVLAFLQSHPPA